MRRPPPPSDLAEAALPYLVQPVQVHLLPHGDVTQRQDLRRGHRAAISLHVWLKGFRQFPDTLLPTQLWVWLRKVNKPSPRAMGKPSPAHAWPPPKFFQASRSSSSSRISPSAPLPWDCSVHVVGVPGPKEPLIQQRD